MSNQYRQGHILLDPLRELPKKATRVQLANENHVVVATGETGREHVFKSGNVALFQEGPDLYIEVTGDEPIYLEHPEHGDIDVEPGIYRVVEQREADPVRRERVSYD
jgi:hypothetical protein